MIFNIFLWSSLSIFGIGLIYKVYTWFSRDVGILDENVTCAHRIVSAIRGIFGVVFSPKILILLKVFILDVIFQIRILKTDFLRWLMHFLIYSGFMLLLIFHALESMVSENLFPGYLSTLNPYLFLRDLFGMMVIAGLAIAVFRRFIQKSPRFKTNAMDIYAIVILAVIMCSGILLEGIKFTSYSEFLNYAEEFANMDDEEEMTALEAFWVQHFALASPNVTPPFDENILTTGEEAHGYYCAQCHSPVQWAFSGYVTAKALNPIALTMDRWGAANILWYVHFISCFIGLAYLPFSKMFHILVSPISLLTNAVMDENASPVNIATRQAMELDACTHCGACTQQCSVAVAYDTLGNANILPSEKMNYLKTFSMGMDPGKNGLSAIQEGIMLCTNCDRCTVVCPSGINLKALWFSVRERLLQQEKAAPIVLSQFSFHRGLNRNALKADDYLLPIKKAKSTISDNSEFLNNPDETIPLTADTKTFKSEINRSIQGETYAYCFSCENCTTVCPVVANYENPREILGLLPHQVMRSLALGLKDLAISANMLWDCTTCYQCQEHCPQNVKVTDVFYELKNQAIRTALV